LLAEYDPILNQLLNDEKINKIIQLEDSKWSDWITCYK
jgi:hypothetical protein